MVGDATANLSGFLRRLTREMAAETLRDLSDQQLVKKILAGAEEPGFQAIVSRHGTMVYGVCWRVLQHQQDAEDAFQATFLVLARKLRTVRKHASLASWLHGVARRTALKAQARAATRRRHERRALAHQAAVPDDATQGELRAVLDVELARLPDKWRLPLILCYLEGRTQDEAADHLGFSKNTLRNRLDEARRMLTNRLKQRGVVWPAVFSGVLLSDCIALAAPAPGLFAVTVEAAAAVAVGKTTAVSAKVAALTEGVLKAMLLSKLKTPSVVLFVVLGLVAFGGGLIKQQALTAEQNQVPPGQSTTVIAPAPDDDKQAKPSAEKRNRAISVEIKQPGAPPEPGEYVDVLASRAGSTKTVGTGLKVLAVAAPQANIVALTLQVSSAEAEALAAVQEDASLSVTRRFAVPAKADRVLGIRALAPGIVKPGTKVDVLVAIRRSDGETTVQKAAENVKVLAIEASHGPTRSAHIVSLAVTPAQAEALQSAAQLGTLRLVAFLTEE